MVKGLTKKFMSAVLHDSMLPRFFHKTFFRNRLAILMYHIVVPSPFSFPDWCILDMVLFKRQLRYLKSHFDVLPLPEAIEKCQLNKLSRPTAVITFDDGFQNNFETVFPVLTEYNFPATIFLTTDFIDTDDTIWFGRINEALARSPRKEFFWAGQRFYLGSAGAKATTSAYLQASLKELSHPELCQQIRSLVERLEDDPLRPIAKHSPFRILDTRSIKEMQHSGLISFGAHTHSHTILSRLPEKEQFEQISSSVDIVKEIIGQPCRLFAYPNGRKQDYTKRTIELLHKCGIHYALTTISGHNHPTTPQMELKRIGIGGGMPRGLFQFAVHTGHSC